eukprot:2183788-Rhodomonas_salina.8
MQNRYPAWFVQGPKDDALFQYCTSHSKCLGRKLELGSGIHLGLFRVERGVVVEIQSPSPPCAQPPSPVSKS